MSGEGSVGAMVSWVCEGGGMGVEGMWWEGRCEVGVWALVWGDGWGGVTPVLGREGECEYKEWSDDDEGADVWKLKLFRVCGES